MAAPNTGDVYTYISNNNASWQPPSGGGGSLPYNGEQIFVSQAIGDDGNSGSYSSPLATMGAARTLAASATNRITINVIDGETYDGNILIDNVYVSIIAPNALFINSTGDVFTITTSSTEHLIQAGGIVASGGNKAIDNQANASLIVNASIVSGGAIQTLNGVVLVNAQQVTAACVETGSGSVRVITTLRTGTNTGSIFSLSPAGTSTNFDVAGTLSASGLSYPTSDGTSGQAIVTDASGNLSFATVGGGGGGLTTNTVSGTSQAAAVNNRYICANAAQTTVTLPTTFAIGDVIVINGLGAAGFIVQCGTGTKIATVDNSVSVSGSLTSANSTDSITLSGLVANTTWAIESIITTGMVPA
jgi:hypothetical protein